MKYFTTLIPKITQGINTFYDTFFNIDITNIIEQEFLVTHEIKDGETLQDIAYQYYDDPQLWWLICLTNNFTDPIFNIVQSEEYIQKLTFDAVTNEPLFWCDPEINACDDSALFWADSEGQIDDSALFWYDPNLYFEFFDTLTELNEAKRSISIIKSQYLSDVISQILTTVNEV